MRSSWLRKLKGIGVLSAIGGAVSALIAGAWSLVSGLLVGYVVVDSIVINAFLWGLTGAMSVGAFATALTTLKSRRRLDEISLYWTALAGGVGGVVGLAVVNALLGAPVLSILTLEPALLGVFAAAGAGLATALVAVAQGRPERLVAESDAPELLTED